MKKLDDPCFYCDRYESRNNCGKYKFFFNFFNCYYRWKKLLWNLLFLLKFSLGLIVVSLIILGVVKIISICEESKRQENHDYLEIEHILVEGDERYADINFIEDLKKMGYQINKVNIVDVCLHVYELSKGGKNYIWIEDSKHGNKRTVMEISDGK